MANQYNNKVVLSDGTVLIDLTMDDVKAEHVKKGIKFHDKTGAEKTGTNTKTVDASNVTAEPAEVLAGETFGRGSEVATGTMPNNSGKNVIVTGKTGNLLGAAAAGLLNALKALGDIDDSIELISPTVIEPVQKLKVNHMGSANPRLHSDEVLIALASSANSDPRAAQALDCLASLRGCQAHCSVILSPADETTYKKLGLQLTCEPKYQTNKLYHK